MVGKIFYIMGKSASGKDKIYGRIANSKRVRLKPLVLYTTRPIRSGEVQGKQYFFVDKEKIEKLGEEGRIMERRDYETVHGIWSYVTADDGQLDDLDCDYLGIGTLESYVQMKKYLGEDRLCPIYIEVEDGERLRRAIKREEKEEAPCYAEMCRRFLADCEDFSEENIQKAGIAKRFVNEDLEACVMEIEEFILRVCGENQISSVLCV